MKAIVIVAHGWNARWLGPYGNEWVETAALDRLAAEGVVFDNHIADVPDPHLAWQSLWTGRYPLRSFAELPIEDLPEDGVRTFWVRDVRWPLDERLEDVFETIISPKLNDGQSQTGLIDAVETAIDELRQEAHWLLWIETDRLLPPWQIDAEVFAAYANSCGPLLEDDDAPEAHDVVTPAEAIVSPQEGACAGMPYSTWIALRSSFAAVTSQFDAELEAIFERFRAAGFDRDCLLVLTSSTGYPLAEHDLIGLARPSLHAERTHLPLLMRLPDEVQAGRRVRLLTQPVDLLPTLLEWFGKTCPTTCHGRSLLPLSRGLVDAIRPYAVSALGDTGSVRTAGWKLIVPAADNALPNSRLFAKPDDAAEVNDLRQHNLEWSEYLEERLRAFSAATQQLGPFTLPPLVEYDDFIKNIGAAAVEESKE